MLYYDEACKESGALSDESQMKFTIQMAYDDVTMRKREAVVTEHMVGELESFQLDQFSEGEIYLKEIRFGSMQSKNDILGLQ